MKGVLFEVDCSDPARGEQIIKDLPMTRFVAVHGILLHVLVDSEKNGRELEKALQSGGVPVERIEHILPSLEDVFVSLVERENRDQVRAHIE